MIAELVEPVDLVELVELVETIDPIEPAVLKIETVQSVDFEPMLAAASLDISVNTSFDTENNDEGYIKTFI